MAVINGVYTIVGVHEVDGPFNDRRAFYRVGHLSNPGAGNYTITWTSGSNGINYTNAINPHIALNTKGQVVEVHEAPNSLRLHYIRGILSQGKIQWGGEDQPDYAETSERPAVTLNDNGIVTEVHTTLGGVIHMARLMGTLNSDGATIDWSAPANFEELTTYPSLSSNGSSVLLSARNERRLYYTVSALADRNNWMGDMMPEIGEKTLSQIVIPGSHDAGMYCDSGTSQLGQTQDQDIYAQLQGGVRFFDLRVKQGSPQRIYHGPVTCDPLTRVMDDVAKFMGEGHKEAVVLEFSHWDGFGDACPTVAGAYEQFRDTVYSRIGRWMYREPTHPAQVALPDIVSDGGKVIVLIDRFALAACNQQEAGFYVYQGWGTDQERLSQGEFTVLDSYSNTTDYSSMKTDQLQLFADFTGKMENDPTYPCDLFLLSWTLTPITDVYHYSREANRNLADVMSETNANLNDRIPNILFVDYYQLARATDVAIAMTNRLLTP
ncbi:MAG TPA: phosphatidylinositol-specific phospholipase C domain-containing protein, partial [Acidobacteriaceae bacterium]|nr:phosphatidylinositol-specific phospholipase C domain-containing protein [Acidobacteriaceae bacterium]